MEFIWTLLVAGRPVNSLCAVFFQSFNFSFFKTFHFISQYSNNIALCFGLVVRFLCSLSIFHYFSIIETLFINISAIAGILLKSQDVYFFQ